MCFPGQLSYAIGKEHKLKHSSSAQSALAHLRLAQALELLLQRGNAARLRRVGLLLARQLRPSISQLPVRLTQARLQPGPRPEVSLLASNNMRWGQRSAK